VRRLILSVLVGSCLAAASIAPASAVAQGPVKTVRYRGYALRVPRSWPVFRLASDPSACVRFNRHAVYLGRPGAGQQCPPNAIGHTEAILVEPLAGSSGAATPQALSDATSARERGSIGQVAVRAHRVLVTATWASDPELIERALGRSSLPRPAHVARAPAAAASSSVRGDVRANAVNVDGYGFDSCAAPSEADMSTWLESSPFRAAGVYIGGANSACAQPNLTASWVSTEATAGWQFIPVYVGLQAPASGCGCSTIAPAQAAAQGTAAAIDAVADAQALGIDQGNPIYDDMEAYTRSASTTAAVLAFLNAWTTELHAYGYVSGVYGSGTSGVTDLVDAEGTETAAGTPFLEPDDLWIADWNNKATVTDPYVPAADWATNQRLHQYRGGHVDDYGGVKLDIDTDFLDGATATAGTGTSTVGAAAIPDGTFVKYGGKTYRLAGGAPLYVSSWSPFGGQQPTVALTAAQWQALHSVPANGTFIRATGTGKTYRIAGGAPVYVSSWTPFGGAQPVVVVDRWNILHLGSSASHLRAFPATGTTVEGLPSGTYWSFDSGWRAETTASTTAVGVSDSGLGPFLEAPTISRDTLSGVAKGDPALRVVLTAGANAPAFKSFAIQLPSGLGMARSGATLAHNVIVWSPATGKELPSAVGLSGGKLTIVLTAPTRKVLIVAASPALTATKAVASAVASGVKSTLAVNLEAIDTKSQGCWLTLEPRTW
jgi:hypothetical protein